MSVIHSLIFQLARKDPNLQDMVRYSNRDPLEFDLASAVNLLTSLIHGAGPVRIVIDGLDEIEQAERVRLLRQMLKVSGDCDEARVLICSRPEADITALLEKTSKSIRIDTQNTPIIHAFAMGRYRDWLQDRFLSPEDSTEIGGLIGALAGQAKGIFGHHNQTSFQKLECRDLLLTRNVPLCPSDLEGSGLSSLGFGDTT